jgi:hypothetical protein
LEHSSETIINGTAPALLAAVVEHVRPLPLRDRSAQKAQHESARPHTHTLSRSLSISPVLVLPLPLVPVPVPVPVWCVVLWTSSLFLWFRFQFSSWSCYRPPSCYGPVPVWFMVVWSSSLLLRSGSSLVHGRVIVLPLATVRFQFGSWFDNNLILPHVVFFRLFF